MDHCGNQAFDAAELKYTVAKLSNRCIPPKPSKGNEAYTGRGSVCSGKKRKQKIQEVLQKPPPTLKTQASSPENKGIISALLKFVRGRKREEKPLAEEKDTREGLKGECLTESDFSFEGSPKVSSSPDFDGTENKEVKVYRRWGKSWHSMKLKQPATFAELGMDPENEGIISDILRFVRDKEIYRKEGKPWKRVYYLFDSPGTTDRSSFIAAMANCVEFDIYDLNLTGLTSISELTNVLASIRSRSLIAIKDFDYWAGKIPYLKNELTLSGLSKIIHGLLSSYGDEQIIVLITNHNHIDGVDAALLRSLNNDLYIHMPSPQPKALSNGREIVLLDSSEQKPMVDFDATNNRAYQRDVLVSNSEEKNTIEASRRQCMPEGVPSLVDLLTRLSLTVDGLDSNAHDMHVFVQSSTIATSSQSSTIATSSQGPPIATSARITKDDLQRLHGSMTRKDAAAILRVSLSTVKRKCREYKIGPWKNGGRKRVWKPPSQDEEGNTSTARETPSHNVQTRVEGELVCQNQEANECRRDFMGHQIALNPESGLIMVPRPPNQHGERNTSTARETPSHNVQTGIEGVPVGQNQEANELRPDFTGGSIHFNTGNGLIGSSFGWTSQVNDQLILSTPYPNHDALGFPSPQIPSMPSENMGGSIDLRNPLASQVVSDGHISGYTNFTFATCSDQAGPSQHMQGQSMHPTVYPDHNVFPQTQIVSSQEPFSEGHVLGFSNGNEHTNFVMIKAFYGDGDNTIFKFPFPRTSGIVDLKKEVSKRLNVEVDRFVVKYMDEYRHLISLPCDEDWMLCLSSSQGNDEIRVFVFDKVGGTSNSCESCKSSMQRRA